MATSAVGLEVGSSGVRFATVSRSRSGPVLEHVGQVHLGPGVVVDGELVDGPALAAAVKQLIKGTKVRTRRIRLGVVSQRSVARQVELPWVPEKEFAQALPLLAADLLPMPVQECVLDFLPYEDRVDDDGQRALTGLLVAANEEGIVEIVDAVETGGLQVTSVTLTPLSILGAVADSLATGPEAVIDVGHSMTTVTIHERAHPHFVRVLSRGGRDITAKLAKDLGMNEADAEAWKCALPTMWATMGVEDHAATEAAIRSAVAELVGDIRTSIDFYTTSEGARVDRAYMTGGAAGTLGLVPILASVLRVPVTVSTGQLAAPGRSLSPLEKDLAATPALAAAVSLALGVA